MRTKEEVLEFLEECPMKSKEDLTLLQLMILVEFPNDINFSDHLHKVAPDDPSALDFETFKWWFFLKNKNKHNHKK